MSDEYLEAINDLSERNTLVLLPLIDSRSGFHKDDEVLVGALEMDLACSLVSLHVGWFVEVGVGALVVFTKFAVDTTE